ncbi:MAG TPA: IS21 family transposase ISGau7 [Gemmatimonas aurantiaca]|uniref:IS21 family transposase ISGau7 n=2 Tax=Gemmatimonas aurantiaca TaxID=173480 RepID=A0A3D4V5M4_9BACT|nr:IS21-like element ISGau7 family transposase [Gemmatimonas aurantiaca]BAH40550.1 putative transposase orfA for insertion sequence element [Gemmatimonas aurantiaca T-27]HCT56426.1 IS21 family transposase ISGau7 [Gemmatimonas aurantiaca]
MSNVLDETKQQQVIALGRLGWSLRRIEAATGVRRETISGYLKATGVAVRRRGGRPTQWPPPNPATTGEVSTDPVSIGTVVATVARPGRAPTASACEPYREQIVEAVRRGRNAMAIWQDLVDQHGFDGRYASVRRFVGRRRVTSPEPAGIIETAPGEEAQVDYGEGPMVRDPVSGKYKRTRLFVLTLGYSRKSVRLLTWRSSSQRWAALHEEAFRRLGGTPRVIVLDNLREGVLTPDVYDAQLNPLYRDVLAHYGVVALPGRVRDPDRKGKVESGIGHTQRTPLKGLRFETLDAAQAYLDQWELRWADTRIHGTTKRQVSVMFSEERPQLQSLPLELFRYYRHGTRVVHLDGCVEVEAAYYSVPPGWIGQQVVVQWDDLHVRVLDPKTSGLLREHLRTRRGHHRVADADRPTRTPAKTLALLDVARKAGPSISAVCEHIHRTEGVLAPRRILGVLALARKHGPALTEDAAHFALEAGAPSYRFLRRYLERVKLPATALKQIDPLIRHLTDYRALIEQRAAAS